jgi:hypothetical protein
VIDLTRCSVLVFTDVLVENHATATKCETSPEILRFAQDGIDQAISSAPQRLTVVVMKALRGVLLMVLILAENSCPRLCAYR